MSELTTRLRLRSASHRPSQLFPPPWLVRFALLSNKRTSIETLQQLPDLIDLLASALSSGVGYREALNWVTSRASGQIRIDFARLTDALNVGDSISNSLLEYEASQSNPALRELALKLALSDQLGTPITEQLISLATALRAEYLVEFRKGGARKETRLLLPLVFLVLPVTVLFAVYPSAQFLQFGSI